MSGFFSFLNATCAESKRSKKKTRSKQACGQYHISENEFARNSSCYLALYSGVRCNTSSVILYKMTLMNTLYQCIGTVIIVIFASVFGRIPSYSHFCPKHKSGWAQLGPCGRCCRGLGAIRAVRRAWQAFQDFLPAGMDKSISRVFSTRPTTRRRTFPSFLS